MRVAGLAALTAVLVLGACSASPSTSATLPGPVPSGVTFREPPSGAPAAPAFELELVDGQVLDLAQQWSQRPVVLVFFETWCTLCRDQQAGINEVAADYRHIILFLGIAGMSEPEDIKQYVSDNHISYPVGRDPTGSRWLQYAVEEPPLVALISKDGRLLRGWPGGASSDDLRTQIEQLVIDRG